MASRTRSRPHTYRRLYYENGTEVVTSVHETISELFVDVIGNPGGDNAAVHISLMENVFSPWFSRYGKDYYVDSFSGVDHVRSNVRLLLTRYLPQLTYETLAFQENNSFELIPFLVDLDDTLKLFSLKTYREISYGAVTWGILPFYSDLMSLLLSLHDLKDRRYQTLINRYAAQPQPFYRSREFVDSGDRPLSSPFTRATWSFEGKVTVSGSVQIDFDQLNNAIDSLLILFDELGFHPDLRTLWDITPLSFVLDYFLPVGDILENIHPRGWFRPEFTLNGTASIAGIYKSQPVATDVTTNVARQVPYDVYERRVLQKFGFNNVPGPDVDFSAPSLRQLVNTAYLQFGNRFESAARQGVDRRVSPFIRRNSRRFYRSFRSSLRRLGLNRRPILR